MSITAPLSRWFLKRWPGSPVEAAKSENLATRRTIPDLDTDSKFIVRAIDRSKLRSVARWAYENDGFTREAVSEICRAVVGTNLRPYALTSDEAWNEAAEARFMARAKQIDASRRFPLSRLLKKWLAAHLVLGDCGVQFARDSASLPVVQTVMPHRIGNYGEAEGIDYFDGVRVDDATGAPTHYRILTGTNPPVAVEVPTSDFALITDPDFADGYRSQCKLGSELLNVLDWKTIIALEKHGVAVSIAPALIDFREGKDGDLLSGETPTDDTNGGFTKDPLTGGMILRRNIGDKVEGIQHNRPTPRLPEFRRELQEPVALALGLSAQYVSGDYVSGSAGIRAMIAKNGRRIRELQSLLEDQVLGRLWLWVIADEIARGELKPNPEFGSVAWQWPANITIDNGRDANSARSDLFAGLNTFAADYGERGEDWRDALTQKAIEAKFIQDLATKYGVSPDRIAAVGNNPQPTTQTNSATAADEPPQRTTK